METTLETERLFLRPWRTDDAAMKNSRRVQEKCGFVYHHTEYDKLWPATGEIKTEHFTCLTKQEFDERCNS